MVINGNGKVKEYQFDGKIMYKLNNNINGKEYDDYSGKLIFEGEYLNGKRHGKGKEYYTNGNTGFEGEYINGKRHGKGKEYYIIKKLEFEGVYLNGKDMAKERNIAYSIL